MFRRIITLLLLLAVSLPGLVAAEQAYWEYTFRPGDSIWKVAEKYTTSVNNWDEIQKINKIGQGPDRRIPPGTRILIPVSMLKLQPAPAVVIAVSGAASLVRANGEKSALITGTQLYSGDQVLTADEQRLRIQFADKSELQVLPNSIVVLDKLSHHEHTGMIDTRIRLNTGRVKTWVEKLKPNSHYEIITPASVTAVRGTTFRLASDNSEISRTEATAGDVVVSAGNTEKNVREGYGIVAEKGKPLPEPVKLLPSPEISDNLSADKSVLKVSWMKLEGAKFYRYELATDEKFNQVIVASSTVNNTIEMNDLKPGRYYLRVRGIDQYKLEGLDAINVFDIQQPPAEDDPSLLIPLTVGVFIIIL